MIVQINNLQLILILKSSILWFIFWSLFWICMYVGDTYVLITYTWNCSMYIGDYYVLISYLQREFFRRIWLYRPILFPILPTWDIGYLTVLFLPTSSWPIPYHHYMSIFFAFRHYLPNSFALLNIVTFCALSSPFCPGLLCTFFFQTISPRLKAYCYIVIHSIPSCLNQIHYLPSRLIVKPSLSDPFSYFLYQYYSSTPITFHNTFWSCNAFHSNPSQSSSSSTVTFHTVPFHWDWFHSFPYWFKIYWNLMVFSLWYLFYFF